MLIERLLANLSLEVEPIAVCEVEKGCQLALAERELPTLHFILRGSGTMKVGNRTVDFEPDCLVLIPHQRRHVVSASGGDGHHVLRSPPEGLIHFQSLGERGEPDVLSACGRLEAHYGDGPALFGLLTEPIVLDFSDSEDMQGLFSEMLRESGSAEPGSKAMLTALMNRCMVIMFRRLCGAEDCPLPWLNALDDQRLEAALRQMLEHPERHHSVESLADAAAMSRTSFAAEFKESFGETPMAFLKAVRLRKAAELLRDSSVNVRSVASRVGFSSRAHFSTVFKEQFGVPPGEYRQRQLESSTPA